MHAAFDEAAMADDYQMLEELGSGSFGVVYKAIEKSTGDLVAIKHIDLEGNVCLNILREDWKPVLNLNAVIVGLQFLFLEPNASDPLNKDAAEDLKNKREGFKRRRGDCERPGKEKCRNPGYHSRVQL